MKQDQEQYDGDVENNDPESEQEYLINEDDMLIEKDSNKNSEDATKIYLETVDSSKKDAATDNNNVHNKNKTSIKSVIIPNTDSPDFKKWILTLLLMILCGSTTAFFGKLTHKIYEHNNLQDTNGSKINDKYWMTYLLTLGSFFIGSFAMFMPEARESFNKVDCKLILRISLPSIMDTFVDSGKYFAYIFLPGSTVSVMKNGTNLLFLAMLRSLIHKRYLPIVSWLGILTTIIGLIIISAENLAISDDIRDTIIGIIILIFIGLIAAIRNDIEEIFLKDQNYKLNSSFFVGLESFLSFVFLGFIGCFGYMYDKTHVLHNIYNNFLLQRNIIIMFLFFLCAVFGKCILQMRMVAITSSLSKKIFQQTYSSGTWLLNLTCFYVLTNGIYGVEFNEYSFVLILGFIVTLLGNFIYIKQTCYCRFQYIKQIFDMDNMRKKDIKIENELLKHEELHFLQDK
eukprot:481633_1